MGQGFGSLTVWWWSKLYMDGLECPSGSEEGGFCFGAHFLSLLTNHEGFIIINSISPAKQQQR